jgi:hypothetical protein
LSGSQTAIILSAAMSFAGNPRTYANQYDHPQANPYGLEMDTEENTIAGERHRVAREKKPPGIGRKDTISPNVI